MHAVADALHLAGDGLFAAPKQPDDPADRGDDADDREQQDDCADPSGGVQQMDEPFHMRSLSQPAEANLLAPKPMWRMSNALKITQNDALIVVDVQNDFLPGGALAVAEGNRVLDPLNELIPRFWHVYATRDWHPRDHKGFVANGGPWPFHCLQGTLGAEISPKLDHDHIGTVISKGIDPETEGYSAFDGTDLEARLKAEGIKRVFVAGLATDYCVKATALEARKKRFNVVIVTDAIAAVKLKPEHENAALNAMRAAGCTLAESTAIK